MCSQKVSEGVFASSVLFPYVPGLFTVWRVARRCLVQPSDVGRRQQSLVGSGYSSRCIVVVAVLVDTVVDT